MEDGSGFPRLLLKEPSMPLRPQSTPVHASNTGAPSRRSPVKFFVLVLAFSLPFWLAGFLTSFQLMPGVPVSALMFVCPVTAALICVYRESKFAGTIELLKRSYDFKRTKAKIWYVPIISLIPAIATLSYVLMRWMGRPLAAPQVSVIAVLGLFLTFIIPALGEELGWSGYVIDPMQERWGALRASVLLGLFWAAWHVVPLLQVHRSPSWIAGWSLGTVAARVIIVWFYNRTGRSVFAAALFHIVMNVIWQLFPIRGSFYDPRFTGPITTLVAAAIAIGCSSAQKTVTPSSMTRSSTLM